MTDESSLSVREAADVLVGLGSLSVDDTEQSGDIEAGSCSRCNAPSSSTSAGVDVIVGGPERDSARVGDEKDAVIASAFLQKSVALVGGKNETNAVPVDWVVRQARMIGDVPVSGEKRWDSVVPVPKLPAHLQRRKEADAIMCRLRETKEEKLFLPLFAELTESEQKEYLMRSEMERAAEKCLTRPNSEWVNWIEVPKRFKDSYLSYDGVVGGLQALGMNAVNCDDHFFRVRQPPPVPRRAFRPPPRMMSKHFFLQAGSHALKKSPVLFALYMRLLECWFGTQGADEALMVVNKNVSVGELKAIEELCGLGDLDTVLSWDSVFSCLRSVGFCVDWLDGGCVMRMCTDEEWALKTRTISEEDANAPQPDKVALPK